VWVSFPGFFSATPPEANLGVLLEKSSRFRSLSTPLAAARPHGYDAAGRDWTPTKWRRRSPMRLRSFGLLVCVMCASCVQAAWGRPRRTRRRFASYGGNLHFNEASSHEFGRRYAKAYLKLVEQAKAPKDKAGP
jgi:hypothetical protein